jgi:hypothetical protein
MIPISKEVLGEEFGSALRILTKWQHKLAQGIPGQDVPGDEVSADSYTREFVAEMLIVAGKLENMANIVSANGS